MGEKGLTNGLTGMRTEDCPVRMTMMGAKALTTHDPGGVIPPPGSQRGCV